MTLEVVGNSRRSRFCQQGHDKELVGRIAKTGGCKECAKVRKQRSRAAQRAQGLNWKTVKKQREERRAGFKYAFHLPAEPLWEAVQGALKRMEPTHGDRKGSYRAGMKELARRYAFRFGIEQGAAERLFARLPHQKTVTIEQGDQIAIFLGLHPVMIWAREWTEPADEADNGEASA